MTATTWGRESRVLWRGWDPFDYPILLAPLGPVVMGLLLIHSGSKEGYEGPLVSFANPVMKQVVFAFIGIVAMFIVSRMDYHYFIHYAWPLYAIGIVSLIGILIIGDAAYGSRRWFDLGPGQVQP